MNMKQRSPAWLDARLEALQTQLKSGSDLTEVQRLIADLQAHQIELEMQNRALKETQRSLQHARNDYAALYDFAPVGYLTLTRTGKIAGVNLTAARMLGEERPRLLGMPLSVCLRHDDVHLFFKHLRTLFREGGTQAARLQLKRRGRPALDVSLESVSTLGRDGAPICRSAMIDITDRARAEAALRESEDRYRHLFMHAPDAILVTRHGTVELANSAAVQLFGARQAHELLGQTVKALFHPDAPAPNDPFDCVSDGLDAPSRPYESRIVRLDGKVVDVEVLAAPSSCRRSLSVHVILRDVTERKTLEQQIIAISTAEQERIGREIHDGIGQELTAVAMLANSLQRRLQRGALQPEAHAAEQLVQQLQQALRDAHSLSRGLCPLPIAPDDLPEAIAALVEGVKTSSGVDGRFHADARMHGLSDSASVQLYRIAQEALHNAARHAHATSIEAGLVRDGRSIRLWVRDDGVGFDAATRSGAGIGLHTMRYRAGVIGAELRVVSSPGRGTRVECTWSHERPDGAQSASGTAAPS